MTLMMEQENDRQIGNRLKEIRNARRLTLSKASEITGVSVSALSKIENMLVSPSFDIIKRICDGLDIALEDLVAGNAAHSSPGTQVLGRKTTTLRGEGAQFTSGQYDYTVHSTELSRKGMVPLELTVRARSVDEFDHWSSHNGEEFVYVLSGAIEIHSEFYAPFRLNQGESAYFDSSMKHLYISVSEGDARVLSVSHDPQQGRTPIAFFMNAAAKPVLIVDRETPSAPRKKTKAARKV